MMKKLLAWTAGIGAACVAYGTFVETRDFRIRTARIPVLAPGAQPILALHLSDAHLLASQTPKLSFLRMLELLEPDLVISTGDNVAEAEAIEPYLAALGGLFDIPGVFVFGSNDYRAPKLKNPLGYLWRSTATEWTDEATNALPWARLAMDFTKRGWVNLMERRIELSIGDSQLEFRGTSDAHISRDNYAAVAGPVPAGRVGIGVTHAPYARVLEAMSADGVSAIFAGHTHGGQVCLPGVGALTTNCDLPLNQAKGLSTVSGVAQNVWLQVSGGLGQSPKAPFRFANPPEVSLVTLVERPVMV